MPPGSIHVKNRLSDLKNWGVYFTVFLFLGLSLSRAAAAAQPMPVDGFWEQVHLTLVWLDSPHTAADWADEAKIWSAIKEVSLPGGRTVSVDTSEIMRRLSANPPDVAGLKPYLNTLEAARKQWSQADCGDCKLGLLTTILARSEFAAADNAADPIHQFLKQIWDGLVRFFNSIFGGSTAGPEIPSDVFTVIISALLLGILFFVFRDIFVSLASEAELGGEAPGEDLPLTASQANQKALDLASSGDYRAAVRYLYLSALLLLDERGLLRYNRTLTNREYLQQVSGQPGLEDNLKWIVDEFDRVWYGFQSIDQDDFTAYLSRVAAIEAIQK